jgi:hypothetical protein
MPEELEKTEARQGDRRRTTRTALFVGTPLAFIVLLVLAIWLRHA